MDSIATRVSRIVAGGAHALLDKAEALAPEASMAQSIREIDQVIDEVRSDLGKVEVARHIAKVQVAHLDMEHKELAAKVEFALSQGRDELAEAAIGRQADIEDLLPVLQRTLDDQVGKSRELEGFIAALNAKRRELVDALRIFGAARTAGSMGGQELLARVEMAERAFGDILARQGSIDAPHGVSAKDAGKLRELTEMQRQHRIAERLAVAKASWQQ